MTVLLFFALFPLHFAVVRHTVCEEHSKLTQAPTHNGPEGPDSPGGEDRHEHCPAAVLIGSPGLRAAPCAVATLLLPPRPVAAPIPLRATLPHPPLRVLAVAPSTSPPRSA